MADPHAAEATAPHVHGEMNISEQVGSWSLFIGLTKWMSLAAAVVILFLTVWFGVGVGFIPALISAAVVAAVGFFALRSKTAH